MRCSKQYLVHVMVVALCSVVVGRIGKIEKMMSVVLALLLWYWGLAKKELFFFCDGLWLEWSDKRWNLRQAVQYVRAFFL